ncbi:alpha/beta fold hydrolase [Nonomuraea salmonea]|uniref:alpha/beta fold hydrolase n=1 Tax=Nonomuraea salmonea TaxID=46181 RepID=UPI0031F0601F
MELEHKRADTNGIRLHYVVAGSGPTVICLHGWPETHREYQVVMERLAGRYRFIAPDLRGFADSDKPFAGYEPKTIAADMLGLLAAERADRFSHSESRPRRTRLGRPRLPGGRPRAVALDDRDAVLRARLPGLRGPPG